MMKSVSAGRVGRATRAGPGDDRDLRDHPGEQHVGVEDPAVAGQRADALLDASTAGVVEEDERSAGGQAGTQHRRDLVGVHLAGAATGDGEVLAGDVHGATEHGALPSDDAVGWQVGTLQPEVAGLVTCELPGLFESARVQQRGDAFARSQLPLVVLLLAAALPATLFDLLAPAPQLRDALVHAHRYPLSLVPARP